jgi:RND family efflux transporter MFP subunit
MKLIHLVTLASTLTLTLAACSPGAAQTPIPTIVLSSGPVAASDSVAASGEIVPARKAQLSFPLTGVVRTLSVKEGDKVTAGQALVGLDTTILEAKAKVADADLRAAQIQYKYLYRTGTRDQEHLDSALADVDRAQALLDSAKATLAQATLAAPFDGTIAAVDITPSESVVPGQVVIIMGDLSNFQVETTDLSERDAPNVSPGQMAEVEVMALNQQFAGQVTDVSRIASTVGGDVVYKVTIEFDTQPAGLLWGMTANVRITTGK